MLSQSKKLTLLVVFYLVSACVLAVIGGAFTDWRRLYLLTKEGQKTSGEIIAKEPSNHRALRYEYKVGNQAYQGIETRGGIKAGDRFDRIRVGDTVEIVFLPTQPDISCACNPATVLRSEILFITMIVILGPIVILIFSPLAKRLRQSNYVERPRRA